MHQITIICREVKQAMSRCFTPVVENLQQENWEHSESTVLVQAVFVFASKVVQRFALGLDHFARMVAFHEGVENLWEIFAFSHPWVIFSHPCFTV